jgi:hypothetical protein
MISWGTPISAISPTTGRQGMSMSRSSLRAGRLMPVTAPPVLPLTSSATHGSMCATSGRWNAHLHAGVNHTLARGDTVLLSGPSSGGRTRSSGPSLASGPAGTVRSACGETPGSFFSPSSVPYSWPDALLRLPLDVGGRHTCAHPPGAVGFQLGDRQVSRYRRAPGLTAFYLALPLGEAPPSVPAAVTRC